MTPDDLAGRAVWVTAKGYRPDIGGMQTYAEMVARAYRDAGASVTVFTQTRAGPRDVMLEGVRLIDIGAGKGPGVAFRLRAAMKRELAASGAPALLHGTTWRTSLVPLSLGLPYVTTFHGREFMRVGTLGLALMRLVARRATANIAVSHYSAARLRAQLRGGPAPLVAWNGISLPAPDAPAGSGEGTVPILSLCRLEPRKNLLACVDALAELAREGHDFHYRIAGKGPDFEPLRQRVAHHGLGEWIELLGFVEDDRAAQLYRDAAIFLHPQIAIEDGRDFEGFGIAIADAMEAETAVIVGSAGGAAELVEDGVSGLAVDGEDPAALVEAIRVLLTDPDRRTRMARAARVRARSCFTWQGHIARILEGLPADTEA